VKKNSIKKTFFQLKNIYYTWGLYYAGFGVSKIVLQVVNFLQVYVTTVTYATRLEPIPADTTITYINN